MVKAQARIYKIETDDTKMSLQSQIEATRDAENNLAQANEKIRIGESLSKAAHAEQH